MSSDNLEDAVSGPKNPQKLFGFSQTPIPFEGFDLSDEEQNSKEISELQKPFEIVLHKQSNGLKTRKATLRAAQKLQNKVICLKYSPDDWFLACGLSNGTLAVYQNCLGAPELLCDFQSTLACSITSVRWLDEKLQEPTLAYTTSNGSVGIRRLDGGSTPDWVKQDKNNEFLAMDVSAGGQEVAVADKSGQVALRLTRSASARCSSPTRRSGACFRATARFWATSAVLSA